MSLDYINSKKIRKSFGKIPLVTSLPNLVEVQKRSYDNIMVSPVTDRIPLASYCRLQDKKTGLNVKANIDGIEIKMQANSSSQLGADKILLSLDEFIN